MSNTLYQNLEWYPKVPSDFEDQLNQIFKNKIKYDELIQLTRHRLNNSQVNKIFNRINKAKKFGNKNPKLKKINLGIISNNTTSHLTADIVVTGLRYGLNINVIETPFNQVLQIAIGELNPFLDIDLDIILLAIDLNGFSLQRINKKFGSAEINSNKAINYLANICEKIKLKFKVPCICQTLPQFPESYFGNIESHINGTNRNFINQFNLKLTKKHKFQDDYIFDVAFLSEIVGTNLWHDKTMFHHAKLPFSQLFVAFYAENLVRLLSSINGNTKKVLVIDLDNTIWGGVIGDDGIDGIKLGSNDTLGEIYQEIQRTILDLRNRGIIIAVCSKNDEKIARKVFKNHPDMILKDKHITSFQINWNDKPSNLKKISEFLNLSLDSFVFMDDNPLERDIVRKHLPMVAVPELENDPSTYVRTLLAGGYFESVIFSEEDSKRVEKYSANMKRSKLKDSSIDLESYLKTLKMKAKIQSFQEKDLNRISQLILRSNQFNLTTKRYNLADIKKIMNDEKYVTFQIRLEDVFGDNGLISLIICEIKNRFWEIDTWIMSCRVLGRKLEEFTLSQIQNAAYSKGVTQLTGIYAQTPKNDLVKDHYKKLGFHLDKKDSSNETTKWKFKISGKSKIMTFIDKK